MSGGLPWQFKFAAKVVLARVPLSYRLWKKAGVFRLGDMDKPEYALRIFRRHFDPSTFARKAEGFTGLELGPGDSLFSALIARAFGASHTYLVDVGPFACAKVASYRQMASLITEVGLQHAPDLRNCSTVDEILAACSAEYLTEGLASLQKIPSGSVDFVWSHVVLEHVRRNELLPMLQELRRIQRPEGVGSHCISIAGVLSGNLNDLRFRQRVWESSFMVNSGFYTNRLRYAEFLSLFREAGFKPEAHSVVRWQTLPLPRRKMAPEFAALPEEDLQVSRYDVFLR
jgi:hypothetical protein